MDKSITTILKEYALSSGADLCGIADAMQFNEAPPGHHPIDLLPGCKSVIVPACRFPPDQLDVSGDAYTYARDDMTEKMNRIAEQVARWLKSRGMKAVIVLSMGQGRREADGRYRDKLSLKHAAMLAGLGKIGKNTLLINNRFGNMIWISAVLTTASLESDPPADYEACTPGCNKCTQSCPVKAIENQTISQNACFTYAYRSVSGRSDGKTEIIRCNTCRVVCPNYMGLINKQSK